MTGLGARVPERDTPSTWTSLTPVPKRLRSAHPSASPPRVSLNSSVTTRINSNIYMPRPIGMAVALNSGTLMREPILIIDGATDSGFLRALLEPVYEVDRVDDGLAGIELVKQKEYGCLLVDLHLPVFGGEALIDYWEAMSPELLSRLVIVTGFSSIAAGLREKVAEVIRKPFDGSRVLECVARCVAQGRAPAAGA